MTCKQSRDTTVSLKRLSSGKIFLLVYRHPSLSSAPMRQPPGCLAGLCYWESPTAPLYCPIETDRTGITIAFVMDTFSKYVYLRLGFESRSGCILTRKTVTETGELKIKCSKHNDCFQTGFQLTLRQLLLLCLPLIMFSRSEKYITEKRGQRQSRLL